MSYPFTGPKMFCAGPNFLSQPKTLTAFSAPSKPFVLEQKPILLNTNHLFVWHKIFVTATICKYIFGMAQKIWTSPKQGIRISELTEIFNYLPFTKKNSANNSGF